MFFIQFEGTPRRNAQISAGAGGAYINCWIERRTFEDAIAAARQKIEAAGWIIDEPEESCWVDDNSYPPGEPGRKYYEQAKLDGEVFVYFYFPEFDHNGE